MLEMEDIKTKIHNLNELWKSAPEELRAAAPGIITNATDIITTTYLYFTELKPLQSIAKHLVEGIHVSPDVANSYLNNCSNCTFVGENREALFQAMTSNEACSNVVRQGMQDIMGSAANKILIVGLVSSGICAAIEGYKAYKFWDLIKDAKNLVEQSPGQRKKISEQLSDITSLVESLDKTIADLRRNDTARDDFDCAKFAADYFINEIRIKVGEFLKEINDLHVEVNGMKEKLRLTRKNAIASAISGAVSGGAAMTNAFILSAFANPTLIVLTMGLGVIHGIVASTNIYLHQISSKQLEELRKEVEKIEKIRNTGLKIQKDVDQKSREIMALTMERNNKFDINKYK